MFLIYSLCVRIQILFTEINYKLFNILKVVKHLKNLEPWKSLISNGFIQVNKNKTKIASSSSRNYECCIINKVNFEKAQEHSPLVILAIFWSRRPPRCGWHPGRLEPRV